jgi:hypothetical protein
MIHICIHDKPIVAQANAWVQSCDHVTKHELPGHLAEGERILAALRAEVKRQEQERDEVLAVKSEIQALQRERDVHTRHCQLLAGYLKAAGGFTIKDLVSEIPQFHVAELEKQKARSLPQAVCTRLKAEVGNSLIKCLTRKIT